MPRKDSKLSARDSPDMDGIPTVMKLEHRRDRIVAEDRSRNHLPSKRSHSPHHSRTHKEKTMPEVEHRRKVVYPTIKEKGFRLRITYTSMPGQNCKEELFTDTLVLI